MKTNKAQEELEGGSGEGGFAVFNEMISEMLTKKKTYAQ